MNNNDYDIIFHSIDIFTMFVTKHILYDLSEASQLLDPDLVAGNPEELKYPYKAPAVRFTESFIFRKPVTFLVGENGAGKSTLLEAMMSKYEERDEEEPGMLYDGTEAYKIYANVLPEHIKLIETRKPEKHFFFRAESFFNHAAELDRQAQLELRKYSKISTHSPILMAYPDADIYAIDDTGAHITPYEETEHYQLTKYFLTHTEQMMKELLG